MNNNILKLLNINNRMRVMHLGADDSYKLFYVFSGIRFMLSEEETEEYDNFVYFLYD